MGGEEVSKACRREKRAAENVLASGGIRVLPEGRVSQENTNVLHYACG